MTMDPIPDTPIRTARLLLRCWEPADAPRFKRSLDASLQELRPWIPWAREEPSELEVLEARLAAYERDFYSGANALYAILDADGLDVLGGVGLYRRVGPGALEIGYWIRSDLAGRGLATEAAAALTRAGLALHGIQRIEIRCDPENAASAAVPRKLGYTHTRTVETPLGEGGIRRTMIWELSAVDPTALSRLR
jgi:RimJ/RimL family protein N-acetyltransferase